MRSGAILQVRRIFVASAAAPIAIGWNEPVSGGTRTHCGRNAFQGARGPFHMSWIPVGNGLAGPVSIFLDHRLKLPATFIRLRQTGHF